MNKKWEIEIGVMDYTITKVTEDGYRFEIFDGSKWDGLTKHNIKKEDIIKLRDFLNKVLL